MYLNLEPSDLINTFMSILPDMEFIPQTDYQTIRSNLEILANIKHNKPRNYPRIRKTNAAVELWKYLINKSLGTITKNRRGHYDLICYYDQYTHYENILFALDKNHRDHVIHCIWVMLIGFHLTQKCRPFEHFVYSGVTNLSQDDVPLFTGIMDSVRNRESSLWILIALTHDLGYPIQKTLIANKEMSDMINNFGFLEQSPFTYHFTTVNQPSIDELLDTLSSRIVFLKEQDKISLQEGLISGQRLDYAKSLERLDHGIMSAYLIQKYLDFICESSIGVKGIPNIYPAAVLEKVRDRIIIINWLRAIADHTNAFRYDQEINNISTLLFLCDELDEFSRYTHRPNSDQWTSIKCETRLNCTKKSLDLVYTFKHKVDFDYLSFFKRKVKKIMNRIELSSNEIHRISITCTIDWRGETDKYYYENRHDSNSDGFVKRSYKGQTEDVLGFINDTVEL